MKDMFGFVSNGFASSERDSSGFYKDAPASQPYMMAIGKCECGKEECRESKSFKECFECCRDNEQQGFRSACGCGG